MTEMRADGLFDGLVRVAAAVPRVRVTDFAFNRQETLALWQRAHDEGCAVVVFPELGLSAYTAGDLHLDRQLQRAALDALAGLLAEGERQGLRPLAFVGLPLFVHPGLYNVAAALQGGRLLGLVPKVYLPNYREFYEQRQFRPGHEVPPGGTISLLGQTVPFGTDLLFAADNQPDLVVGVEICEDGWVQLSPNAYQTSAGATVCGNLSASNLTVGKAELRHRLCWKASDPGKCAYIYTAAGPGESSADLAFDAHALIYENGRCLAESVRFDRAPQLITADVDLDLLLHERLSTGSFGSNARANARAFRRIPFTAHAPTAVEAPAPATTGADRSAWAALPAAPDRPPTGEPATTGTGAVRAAADGHLSATAAAPAPVLALRRAVDRHPFVPKDPATLATRCWEVFQIQTSALITRLEHLGTEQLVLGLSGGRDSTLAALACANALDQLGRPRTSLLCLSMPGFGTSAHTREASRRLAEALGASFAEEDIRAECQLILAAQGHPTAVGYARQREAAGAGEAVEDFVAYLRQHPEGGDVEFENVQARVRTLRLMTRANRGRGMVIGTGDLSEKALGWSTYAGDHIAMYDLNAGIPKTLVNFIIRWVATDQAERWTAGDPTALREALFDILAAPITPELVPLGVEQQITQLSEDQIGPYELHDFFLYWVVRHGARPRRVLALAQAAFGETYPPETLRKWLIVFYRRFFGNQWKRDCTADGPKVGTVALSPRGDWRMPSDAVVTAWIAELQGA
jgi:NAD+ synthase (glutamine-hydrolysing)